MVERKNTMVEMVEKRKLPTLEPSINSDEVLHEGRDVFGPGMSRSFCTLREMLSLSKVFRILYKTKSGLVSLRALRRDSRRGYCDDTSFSISKIGTRTC